MRLSKSFIEDLSNFTMTLVISEQRRLHIQLGALSVIQKQSTFKSSFVAISMPNSPPCLLLYIYVTFGIFFKFVIQCW
jgi:hypothetical protein